MGSGGGDLKELPSGQSLHCSFPRRSFRPAELWPKPSSQRFSSVIPPPEFPSSQSLHCSEQCELCVRVRTENFVSLEIMPAVIVLSSFFCFSTDETAAGREGCRGRETEEGSHGRGNSFKVFLSLSPEFGFFSPLSKIGLCKEELRSSRSSCSSPPAQSWAS